MRILSKVTSNAFFHTLIPSIVIAPMCLIFGNTEWVAIKVTFPRDGTPYIACFSVRIPIRQCEAAIIAKHLERRLQVIQHVSMADPKFIWVLMTVHVDSKK
mmetsp:Transcript_23519/g.44347  ORF Transcript_23519/g.44347 Transcript_23519/m.44347 type:complete len:101 (+) Transcript_23519:1319-1621(+)